LGLARLSAFVKTLTTKPLLVVNTHGHPDHAGGDFEFKSVYAHPADFSSIQSFSTKEARQRSAQFMGQGPATPDRSQWTKRRALRNPKCSQSKTVRF
jgi:glyoxylase-like metal-dependent hydrolase (beta-lactamase superfamily II)